MAGEAITITETNVGSVKKIKLAWTSGSGGESPATATTFSYSGQVMQLTTVPSGGGTAPTDNYDLTLADADGVDVLAGGGADRDTANTEHVRASSLGMVAGSVLTLTVANAGNSKQGTAYVYIR
ncbi:MAG: hypothetical protein PHQ28_10055 [Mycobacterium sp.]|jgi:hypothetical protein|nr:hypothetical protein [Mycobacterium sp.]